MIDVEANRHVQAKCSWEQHRNCPSNPFRVKSRTSPDPPMAVPLPDSSQFLVPEWAEQCAVLIAWPYAEGDFRPWLPAVEDTYGAIGAEIASRETLIIACQNEGHRHLIASQLAARGVDPRRLRYVVVPYDDVWVRDTAPLTVATPEGLRFLDFGFNGWGGKYPHAADALLAQNLHRAGIFGEIPLDRVDFILEGGSVESDGAGTVMTTSRCLLNPNRNPALRRDEIEARLRTSFGVEQILWLDHGHAAGDDTDAHIDTLARFCSPDTIAHTACDRPDDDLYGDFQGMAEQLSSFTSTSGRPYRLVPLPVPRPIVSEEGERLPATYANFLIINGAVLVPVYDDPADDVALGRLVTCFPGREIVPIPCLPLIRQYGSLHCMTMQFPKNPRSSPS